MIQLTHNTGSSKAKADPTNHLFKKGTHFIHDRYTRTALSLADGTSMTLLQNRCGGRDGHGDCPVSVFFLIPEDDTDLRRFLVLIPDAGAKGHNHLRVQRSMTGDVVPVVRVVLPTSPTNMQQESPHASPMAKKVKLAAAAKLSRTDRAAAREWVRDAKQGLDQ